jgi:hypothetical protein
LRCEDAVVTERTLIRARAGDEDAFRELDVLARAGRAAPAAG